MRIFILNKKKVHTIYEESLKDYWDLKSSMDTYYMDGQRDKATEMASKALEEGLPLELIQRLTGLTKAAILALKQENK